VSIRFVFCRTPALVICTDALPAGRGGEARGPLIRIRPRYREDSGILAHEMTHVRQWWSGVLAGIALAGLAALWCPWWPLAFAIGALSHPLAYLLSRRYRLWSEVQAYREQARHYADDRRPLFARFIAANYRLSITMDEALAALRKP